MRLFVAVWPSPEVVASLRDLPRPVVPGLRWTTEDQWHVTLRFLGEADEEEATAALWRLRWAECPEAVASSSVAWFGRSVLYLPVVGLDAVAAAVATAMGDVGPPGGKPFRGHLTVGRANRGRADLGAVARAMEPTGVDGRWTVDAVTLVASRLERKGARYEVVASVPLPTPV